MYFIKHCIKTFDFFLENLTFVIRASYSKPHSLHNATTQTLPSLSNTAEHLKTEIVGDVCHFSSVAQVDCDLIMNIQCKLVILILALTLDDQGKLNIVFMAFYNVHTGYHSSIIVACMYIFILIMYFPPLQFIPEKSLEVMRLCHIAGPTWCFWWERCHMTEQNTVVASF